MKGVPLQTLWDDIYSLRGGATERLGYPTQKPLALLERIIQVSSNPGDMILDPFCGCGTAITAAQKLNRRWIGIDITHLAITLQKYRLKNSFNILPGRDYRVIGEPSDYAAAEQLAKDNRYQFQWWALSLVGAKPIGEKTSSKAGKKGKDRGIDGIINFIDDTKDTLKSIVIQVKSGKVKPGDIRDLHGVIERENAAIGVFISLEPPTQEMEKESASVDFYTSKLWQKSYPRIQILTIKELLDGKQIQMPPSQVASFKSAEKIKLPAKQTKLDESI
jgi:site-specific DNA-methyltransferase (adenine-specific)